MSELIECSVHGNLNTAFVCQHLLESLNDDVARGIVWSIGEDDCYSAYCNDCAAMLKVGGGEWTDELAEKAEIKLVCEGCVEQLFVLNNIEGGR